MIIGITGTLGSGKGTIVNYLVENKGFQHFSVRDFLIEEIKKRGMIINRNSMVVVANDLRSKNGPAYIIEKLYKQAVKNKKNSIIESLRVVGEIEMLKKKENFIFFAVDADSKVRYDRIVLRGSETDKITYDEFVANEQREMNTTDPTKQNLSKCIEMADYIFTNNGSLEELHHQIEDVITKLNI